MNYQSIFLPSNILWIWIVEWRNIFEFERVLFDKNATNTTIFLMLNLRVILLPLLVYFTYSEFVKSILNISSFLTLPHLLDYLICTRNSVSIEFL